MHNLSNHVSCICPELVKGIRNPCGALGIPAELSFTNRVSLTLMLMELTDGRLMEIKDRRVRELGQQYGHIRYE
jgi:hypothetical protein